MALTHLHVHSEYSLLDGLSKIPDMVKKAKENGMTALALTDHGTAAGLVTFYDECKKQGIKPILGCEFYEAPESRFKKEKIKDERDYFHLIILVKNETGYKNLCKLVTRSWTEGFYYKPRIDMDLLREFHEGLICLSACVAGRLPQAVIQERYSYAESLIERYKEIFGDDYYIEIQNHGLEDEQRLLEHLPELAKLHNVKIVATNDSHYVNSEDAEAHDWLVAMQTKKTVNDPTRMHYIGDYSLKSEEEMKQNFDRSLWCAIENTQEVADKCGFDFHYAKTPADYRMPKVVIPKSYKNNYYKYLQDEADKGFDMRYPEGHAEREQARTRLDYEMSVIKQMGFAEYFIDTRKTIFWSRAHGILVGPGRGSGVGSVLNYCLRITDIDPLPYGLIFERFLNPSRISMPDIDVDYDYSHKDEVIASEADSNGKDKFAKIRTFMTMAAKEVLKGCTRTAELPVSVGEKFSKLVGQSKTLKEAWESNPDLQEFVQSDPQYRKIWEIALKLEGTKKSASTHACGHIPTPVPCEQLFPCAVDPESGYLVSEYDMVQIEHLGNLKKDLLMLRNLTVIDVAHKAVKRRRNIDVPLWNEEILNNRKALQTISNGDTNGVFQFEGDGMTGFMKNLKPDAFEDIVAGVAMYRPGPMDMIPTYIENKHNPDKVTYETPLLEPILKNTYGVIVYQEQVMQIVQALAGFSMARADLVRKAMGRLLPDMY